MPSSMMKCGIPAAKSDIIGVSGHVPGTSASQNLRIGVHCMQMSVTCSMSVFGFFARQIDAKSKHTLAMIHAADSTKRMRIGHRIIDKENIRQ